MLLRRFYDAKLAQASYLIGCARSGEALIVDANRDIDQYLRAAEAEGMRIAHVTETHIHADYVSGSRELANRTGARLYLSAEGGADWQYGFAREAGAVLLRDGDELRVGNVIVRAMHTPGHTPEHLSFLVTDSAGATKPMGVLTGDFVFVGDVGRPDLLERAAKMTGTMESGARALFQSIQRFKTLPDYLQLWPGHGAGSACGKALGAVPQTTLGYERMFNWAFEPTDESAFIEMVLAGQPEPPRYFAEMKRMNRDGPRLLGGFAVPQRLPESRLAAVLDSGSVVVDARHAADFAAVAVPGSINIPLNRSFTTYAGSLLPYDRDIYLIVDDAGSAAADAVAEAVKDLAMIGLDRVAGYFGAGVVEAWAAEGRATQAVPQLTAAELAPLLERGAVTVIDVRGASEYAAGHLPGVPNIPLGDLPDRLEELPRDTPLVVQCQSGGRSAIAASLLLARGFRDVTNLQGGFAAWQSGGMGVERGEEGREVGTT
ncbi:MAG TPA: MBL fold metallo-hydrolase [Gemmatimonadaceae bacterium]|nr:MBL fold metallo-hydrolase [Gemmatimonadaceae bacterium]